jgi:hypothetical protein
MKQKGFLLTVCAAIALITVLLFAACKSLPTLTGNISISVQGGGEATPEKTLVAEYNGEEVVTFQWRRDSTNLGTTNTQYAGEPGNYTVIISSEGFRNKTSAVMRVAWPDIPGSITINVQGGGAATPGKTLVASYTGGLQASQVTYQWRRGSTTLGTAATQLAAEAGSYTVEVIAPRYTAKRSAAVNVVVPDLTGNIAITVQGGGDPFVGKTLVASYTGGNETVTYQWRRGSTNLGTASTQVATEIGSYTVVVSATNYNSKTSAAVNVVPVPPVTISSDGTTFTATRGSTTIGTGTIQAVINAIRAEANGSAVSIQFGTGGANVLDIDSASISFEGTWGIITLSGSITSSNTSANSGTIVIAGNYTVNSTGTVANTSDSTNGNGRALRNNGTGTLTISAGTVRADTSVAVFNNGAGNITITGGTVRSNTGIAIQNNGSGRITISGGVITSSNANAAGGTIVLASGSLTVSGGTLQNSVASSSSRIIRNNGTGAVTVSGGTVTATNGNAIHNDSTGSVTVSGGTVSATSGNGIFNNSTGPINVSGGTIFSSSAGGMSIRNNSTGTITLSGNPVIRTGIYRQYMSPLYVSSFSPGETVYILDFGTTPSAGTSVVYDGASYQANFRVNSTAWILVPGGRDLVFAASER